MSENNTKKTNSFFSNKINVLILIFALVCMSASIALKLTGMSGNDFWWHIKAGEWIFENKKIPTTALFTWYGESQSLNWYAHEWLTEVIFYLIYNTFGSLGMYQICLSLGLLIIGWVVYINRDYIYNNIILSSLYMLYFVIVITQFFYGRPHTINMILLFILLLILYKYKESDTKTIYFLPLLSIIWVNLHGGSSNLIYIIPIIFILGSLIKFEYGKLKSYVLEKKRIIKLCIITLVSALALFINPRGLSMITYPYENMADNAMLKFLSEWESPDAKDFSILILCYVPVIIVTLILMFSHKKIDLVDFFLYGFFTYMFFRSQRFISLFMIVTSFFIFKYMLPFTKKKQSQGENIKANRIATYMSLIIFAGIFIWQFNHAINLEKKNSLIDKILPNQFVEAIKKDNPERLFNDYTCGGPLIYNNIKVFIDGRADIYTGSPFVNYQSLKYCRNYNPKELDNKDFYEELLDEYNFDGFLVDNTTPIYHYLCQFPDKYIPVESDKTYTYFKTE